MRISGKCAAALAALAMLTPMAARADSGSFLLGQGARSLAMGGAHIALDDRAEDAIDNPAVLGGMRGIHYGGPQVGVDAYEGPSLSDLANRLNAIANTSAGKEDFDSLVQIVANRPEPSTIAASGKLQLGYGPVLVSVLGQARLLGFQAPPVGSDGLSNKYGLKAGYAVGPVISYGMELKNPIHGHDLPPMKLGVNLKFPSGRTVNRTFTITRVGNTVTANQDAHGTDPSATTSFGMDLGLLLNPTRRLTYGLALQNVVPPNIPGLSEQTVATMGVAYHASRNLLVAVDLANFTGAYGDSPAFRAGAEWKPLRFLALRGGFSNYGVTFGAGLFGYDIAYSPQNQQIAASILHF